MADDILKAMAIKQRKRLIAGLLGAAETSAWWRKLSPGEQREYRDKVLTSAGQYHDMMLDMISSLSEGTVVNTHAIELIESLHAGQRRLEKSLGAQSG